MNTYNENESNRKQAMIPIIALFICFLAIAGVSVAYAFNSSIQINDNPVNEQYFTLDYTDGTGGTGGAIATVLPANAEDMTVTTHIVANGVTRTFNAVINEVVPAENTASFERVFYVKLASNMDADQEFAITGSVDKTDTVINAIFGDCTNAFKMYDSTDTEVDMGHVTANQGATDVYKVVLTVPINANVNVKTIPGLAGASAIVDASTLDTALSDLANHKFSVTLTATPVDPAPAPATP